MLDDPMPDTCGPYTIGVLVSSLKSNKCPACGNAKRPRHSLCGGCFVTLPANQRNDLYKRIGRGYGDALGAAFKTLDVDEPKLPE